MAICCYKKQLGQRSRLEMKLKMMIAKERFGFREPWCHTFLNWDVATNYLCFVPYAFFTYGGEACLFRQKQFHLLNNLQPASCQGHSYSLEFCRRSLDHRVLTGSIDLISAPSRRCLRPEQALTSTRYPTRPELFLLSKPDPNYISKFLSLGFFPPGCFQAGRFKSLNNNP